MAFPKHADEIEGRSLVNFVVAAASAAARQTVEQTEIIRLLSADRVWFFEGVRDFASPPAPAICSITSGWMARSKYSGRLTARFHHRAGRARPIKSG